MKKGFTPYQHTHYPPKEMQQRAEAFYREMNTRRSIRHFSTQTVPEELIATLILTASTAPSGAHKQPWTFCAVSDPRLKKAIREAAEKEEYENYHGRMSEEWLRDLASLDTDWHKPFLEDAPWLIIVFKRLWEPDKNGHKHKNYYVSESVGLACGLLLAAIHHAGLVSLTHTPSPMNFLQEILQRPENERPFLLIPVGYPAENVAVPDLRRKGLGEIVIWNPTSKSS